MALNIVAQIDGPVKVNRVIVSVWDKTGLDTLIPRLVEINPRIQFYSTGGTFKLLHDLLGPAAGRHLFPVSAYTGQPEMQGGLVKTLDFRIYLGLLSETYNPDHARDIERTQAVPFDMVIGNLYPFAATVAGDAVTVEQARTNIDIGGPCMLRAAAKNFLRVASVTEPGLYPRIVDELAASDGSLSLRTRYDLARRAFEHTAKYDAAIAAYLLGREWHDAAACYTVRD